MVLRSRYLQSIPVEHGVSITLSVFVNKRKDGTPSKPSFAYNYRARKPQGERR